MYQPPQSQSYPARENVASYPPQPGHPIQPAGKRLNLWQVISLIELVIIICMGLFIATHSAGTSLSSSQLPSGWVTKTTDYGFQEVIYLHWNDNNGQVAGQMELYVGGGTAAGTHTLPIAGTVDNNTDEVVLHTAIMDSTLGGIVSFNGSINGDKMTLTDSFDQTKLLYIQGTENDFKNDQVVQ